MILTIVRHSGNSMVSDSSLAKFSLGSKGYYTGLIAPAILIAGAIIVFFVIMSQVMYPDMLAIYAWISRSHPAFDIDPSLF